MLNHVIKGFFYKSSLVAFAAIATALGTFSTGNSASANETSVDGLLNSVDQDQVYGQVTSVSQLSDVSPTDWAFQAVQSLVERYGCIAGYPDGTFRGNRNATRYELAAALNACLDQISDRFATKEDLDAVKALQEEFAAELATLRGRVDGLEARTATLEAQQFSTVTKLKGEAIFSAAFVADDEFAPGIAFVTNAGDTPANIAGGGIGAGLTPSDTTSIDDRAFLTNRARLNFDTSFSGTDLLHIRLQASNIPNLANAGTCGTELCRLGFDGDTGNVFELDELNYLFKPTKDLSLKVSVIGGDFRDDVETFNPLRSSGSGALSRFFRFNPATHRGPADSLVSAVYEPSDKVSFAVAYGAQNAEIPVTDGAQVGGSGSGLFGGSYALFAQVGFTPTENLRIGVNYAYKNFEGSDVDLTQGTGDAPTNLGGDSRIDQPFGDIDTIAHNAGLSIQFQPTDGFIFAGWAGVTLASAQDGVGAISDPAGLGAGFVPNLGVNSSQITAINWAANFIFPDLFAEGNRGSVSVGQAPFIIDGGDLNISDGQDPNFLVEAQYQFKVSKFIKISPGVIVVVNPENTANNGPVFIPLIRTTFSF